MDLVLDITDALFFDRFYAATIPATSPLGPLFAARDSATRQSASLWLVTVVFGYLLYFFFAGANYVLFFRKEQEKHPKFLKNQMQREIWLSMTSIPVMAVLTLPWQLAEVRGYSRLYADFADYGWGYAVASATGFLFFTDMLIYWIHRFLHHPVLYSRIHKPHHLWKVPTPFASHAFHPIDGYLQSLPYHIFVFLFPLHRMLYLGLFVFVNMWTISIHDGNFFNLPAWINGAAHHNLHHLEFRYNYGQYFTLWDKIGSSYKRPVMDAADCGADPNAKED